MSIDSAYHVVVNDEDQYSIWPAARDLPAGWRSEGRSGPRDTCLTYIDEVWTDQRPRSLREATTANWSCALWPGVPPAGTGDPGCGHVEVLPLDVADVELVTHAADAEGVHPAAFAAAAWAVLLARYDRTDCVGFAFEARGAGRVAADVSVHRETPVRRLVHELHRVLSAPPAVLPDGPAAIDLTVRLSTGPQPRLDAAHRSDPEGVRRQLGHLWRLTVGMASAPQALVEELPTLTKDEERAALSHTGPAPDWPPAALHELVLAQCVRTPEIEAIRDGARGLTYGELAERVAGLAEELAHDGGVRCDEPVAVLAERSIEAIVAQLAIMAAGGAFLPLDPADPAERVAAILADARCRTVVVRTATDATNPAMAGLRIVPVCPTAKGSRLPPSDPTDDRALAYVIYTSGSTGTPKGVMIDHRAITNFIRYTADYYAFSPGDRVLQFAALPFDTSLEEIYCTLISGATLVIREPVALESLTRFLDYAAERGLTVLDLPTMFWHELVPVLAAGHRLPDAVRLVIIAGSAANADALRRWHSAVGFRVRLVNTYGPTETTICTVLCDLTEPPAGRHVHIGRPVANTGTLVVDPHGQLAPDGVPGELYVTGHQLARGYLGQEELTRQRFRDDLPVTRERAFATRDLVVRGRDEMLTYLGRLDRQLKINGYRVEPDEIEAVLSGLPEVDHVAVVASEPPSQLVAFVVSAGVVEDDQAFVTRLRGSLRHALPTWMIPARFQLLPRLPLNSRGKPDHEALAGLVNGGRSGAHG